ncbi:hypothetical protein NKJ46_02250 [Mesorhizobium sp. M0166]|uniref:hypothetical protein n=1 Tax=unclassified Mesorhizobium TaxID=325217 RepID=UPI00333965D4
MLLVRLEDVLAGTGLAVLLEGAGLSAPVRGYVLEAVRLFELIDDRLVDLGPGVQGRRQVS